jgi:hypothetical protein
MERDQPRISQQDFRLAAMRQCGMGRHEFAAHISAGRSALDKWLLPEDSADFRAVPEMGRAYISQVVHSTKERRSHIVRRPALPPIK